MSRDKQLEKQKKETELYNIANGVPDIAENACNHLSRLIDGNGLKSADIRITEQQQEVLSFKVVINYDFQVIVSDGKIIGNSEKCSSKDDVQQKIAVLKQQYLEEPHTLFLLLKHLKELPFYGWGHNQKIILKELAKNYIYNEKCRQCGGAKKETCSKCFGKGNMNCFNCKGFGLMNCLYCDGTGMLADGSGGQKECHKCYGKRKSKCTECHGKKYLICDLCRGSKYISCKTCGQTGYVSVQTHVEFESSINAPIDEKLLPPPLWKLYEKMEQKGLAEGQHVKITLLAPNEVEQATQMEQQTETIVLESSNSKQHQLYYKVELPIGKAEFSIGDKRYKSDIVGYQSQLIEIDNFLDILIKPGIKALQKISQGPMAQQALIDKALKYRLIKQVFVRTGKMSKGRILKFLRNEYQYGLSDKYAKAAVQFADKAIGKITKKPRVVGMVVGVSLAFAVFSAWFFMPLRKFISSIPEQQQIFIDIGLMAGFSFLTYYIVRLFAGKALAQFMTVHSKQAEKQALPPAGNQGIYAGFATICAFLAMAYFAPVPPSWIEQLVF